MNWNLHTHTPRCHHASGTEEEMVLAALDHGIGTMGFADHAPMPFTDGFVSGIRMLPEELPGYVRTLRELRETYQGRIGIPIGLEAEYFPDLFDSFLDLVRENEIEFLILGQHYVGSEAQGPYVGKPTENAAFLHAYVDTVCEAMDTGVFTYCAHPDLIRFIGEEEVYETEMRRLARHASKRKMPLELNINGARDGRNYPDPRFWSIAAEEGCKAVIGIDAHHPKHVWVPEAEEKCRKIAREAGIPVLEEVPLILPEHR